MIRSTAKYNEWFRFHNFPVPCIFILIYFKNQVILQLFTFFFENHITKTITKIHVLTNKKHVFDVFWICWIPPQWVNHVSLDIWALRVTGVSEDDLGEAMQGLQPCTTTLASTDDLNM